MICFRTPVKTDHTHTYIHMHTHSQTHWSFIVWTVLVNVKAQNRVLVDQRSEFVSQTWPLSHDPTVRTTTWPSPPPVLRLPCVPNACRPCKRQNYLMTNVIYILFINIYRAMWTGEEVEVNERNFYDMANISAWHYFLFKRHDKGPGTGKWEFKAG